MTENELTEQTEDVSPAELGTPAILSHESLIALERHITALLYAIWREIGVKKRIIRTSD